MSVNKVILISNVGKEPEVRTLDGGLKVASFTFATTEKGYTMQNGTQVPERTEWHYVVAWRGIADVVERYVHKGDKLYIEGKIRTRSYDDKAGVKRYVTEIFIDSMEMLTPKSQQVAPPALAYQPASQVVPSAPTYQPAPQTAPQYQVSQQQAFTSPGQIPPPNNNPGDLPF